MGRKRSASLFSLAAMLALCLCAPGALAYNYSKSITIDRSKIPNSCGTTLASFPVLFSVTDASLKLTSNGGKVTNAAGDDIIFRGLDTTTCGGASSCTLDHEIEKYDNTTGQLIAWVRVPALNTAAAGSDTVIYINYGDSTVTTPTQNPTGVWDSNFKGVWHNKETSITGAAGEIKDRTSNANNGTTSGGMTGANQVAGQIGGSLNFDGVNDQVSVPNSASLNIRSALTMEAWINATSRDAKNWNDVLSKGTYDIYNDKSGKLCAYFQTDAKTYDACPGTATMATGTWYHVVETYNAGSIKTYINGVQDGIASQGTQLNDSSANSFMYGVCAIGGCYYWIGKLDEVRVSSSVRSVCWIKGEYNNQVWPDKAVTPSPNPSPNPNSGFYTLGAETPLAVVPGGFNAYENATTAGAITGLIKTKIAGASFYLDLIALNPTKTAILNTFLGTVKVELLDSSGGGILDANGCNASWTIIQTLATNPVFVIGDKGRKTVSFQENNAWRNVRVRISFPDTGVATAIGCSSDNFAIRPNSLSFSVTDGDWETAGTTRTLNNASTPGGTVHKAGRPFTITVTGYNGASTPAITTNYAGTPTTSITAHLIPTSCLNGTACMLNGGTFTDGTANDGIVISATASYAEVGAFNMQLADPSFADVDAGDSTTAERYISSGTVAVGRFVPDHFSLSSGSRTPACTTGGAVLSYMSQPFTLAATLVAQNFAGGTTENYHPSSGGYAPAAVVWQAENADSGTNLTARLVNVSATWSYGSYVVNSTTATFNRAAAPDGPYDSLQLGTQITDPDSPVLGGLDMNAATSGACAPCTARTVGAPISARFGRLKLSNAYGSELHNLPIPIQTQYWSGVSFVTNTADSCTTLAAGNVKLTAAPAGVVATVGGAFSSGVGSLTLSRPSPATTGAVGVCVDLAADPVGGTVCSATASANLPYMQGLWSPGTSYNNDPGARATFGVYKGNNNFIYQRENY